MNPQMWYIQVFLLCCILPCCFAELLNIIRAGNGALRAEAEHFHQNELNGTEIEKLAQNMVETLKNSGGVGLAAPQVNVSKRMFLLYDTHEGIEPPLPPTLFANPVVSIPEDAMEGERIMTFEGCLSIPDIRAFVPRFNSVILSGYDPVGHVEKMMYATGYVAIIIQHEFDHLNGVLFVDKMDAGSFSFDDVAKEHRVYFGVRDGTWKWMDV